MCSNAKETAKNNCQTRETTKQRLNNPSWGQKQRMIFARSQFLLLAINIVTLYIKQKPKVFWM